MSACVRVDWKASTMFGVWEAPTLAEAKEIGEAALAKEGGFSAVSVVAWSGAGRVKWKAVPRTRNTGPGRIVWERAS